MGMATVWSVGTPEQDGTPSVRDPDSVSFNAAIESAPTADTEVRLSPFAIRVQREATRREFDLAERQVIIGDGAKWIWNIADELFPEAIQVIDLYHAKGSLSDTARAIFGAESELAVGTRPKRAGMHWSLCGANSIVALLCGKLNQRYDEYWKSRRSASLISQNYTAPINRLHTDRCLPG